jgi:hypothetical protein
VDEADQTELSGAAVEQASVKTDKEGLFGKSGKVIGTTLDRKETNVVIHLSELRTIASVNSKSTFWWSVTTLMVGVGLALFLSGLTINQPTAAQIALIRYLPMVCGVFAVFSVIAAMREASHWKSEIFKIEREHGLLADTWPVRIRRWWYGKDV